MKPGNLTQKENQKPENLNWQIGTKTLETKTLGDK
jgi:hypothetical protein